MPDESPGRKLVLGPELCKLLDISPKTFMRYQAAGMPRVNRPGMPTHYEPDAVKAWMKASGLTGDKSASGTMTAADEDTRKAYIQAKLRKEQAMASKYEHQVALAKGQTISKQAYQSESLAKIAACKARLLALPGKLAGRLVGLSAREIQLELEREVKDVLAEFALRDVAPLVDPPAEGKAA